MMKYTFIIAHLDTENKEVWCYEQTPYKTEFSFHSYEGMANNGYMPYSKR